MTLRRPPLRAPRTMLLRAPRPASRTPSWVLGALLVASLIASITMGVTLGPVRIAPTTVWRIVGAHLFDETGQQSWTAGEDHIVWLIRLPRVLLGALVGAGLATVGVVTQALVRNVLADPYLLGVSSGASVGAAMVILFGLFGSLGIYALSGAAFLGALGAMVMVFLIARQDGQLTPIRLILSGAAMSYVLSALTSFLVFKARTPDGVRTVLFWLLGSLGGARWSYLAPLAVALVLAGGYLALHARSLNALSLGDETATTLGIDVGKLRVSLFLVASLLTGMIVAVSGAVGFVGLMLPHAARMLVGADHRRVLPIGALLGAIFMVWIDVAARTAVAPQELPLGVVTALIGAPFFIALLRRSSGTYREA